MDGRLICPECNKPNKHLISHLKNKHEWEVEDIFNYNLKSKDANDGEKTLLVKWQKQNLK